MNALVETETHIYFWNSIYSQWYPSKFVENGKTFVTAEQYMMFNKAMLFDSVVADKIMSTSDPKIQKMLGKQVKNFNQEIWDENKFNIVVQGNLLKFTQNLKLQQELLRTNKILVEGSPYDTIWGVGVAYYDKKIFDEKNWRGENLLGKALMKVRNILNENRK
jgi:ribA/ribD-fused uncharacterized protein